MRPSDKTGKPPILVRWVITIKGDSNNYNGRARLVAKHTVSKYGGKGFRELFAAIPPFEMVKLLLVRAISKTSFVFRSVVVPQRIGGSRKIMLIDTSKVHLYALINAGADGYVDLPPECRKHGVCGRLNYWLYGKHPASTGCETEYTTRLVKMGFVPGTASPCCFHRHSNDVSIVVHGGDFVFEGLSHVFKI